MFIDEFFIGESLLEIPIIVHPSDNNSFEIAKPIPLEFPIISAVLFNGYPFRKLKYRISGTLLNSFTY